MPLPTNNSRPSLPYNPEQSLPNNQRFDLLGKRPPTAEMFDAEFNSLQDDVNTLAKGINDVQAGNIPGSDNPINANKLVKTDGAGNLSFTSINSALIDEGAVTMQKLAPQSVTTSKLGDGSIIQSKMAADSVNTINLLDEAVTTEKMAPGSIQTSLIADNAVTTDEIANNAVTASKIVNQSVSSEKLTALEEIEDGVCEIGGVPTILDNQGHVGFRDLPLTGKILQIKSTIIRRQNQVIGATAFTEFQAPFNVSITTKAANSTVLVFLSANLLSGYSQNSHILYPQTLFYALFKNGVIWPAASGTPGTNQTAGLGQVRCYDYQQVSNVSALINEIVPNAGTTNTYSLRALCGADYYVMMNSQLPDDGQGNYSGVASVSSLYAIEVGG